MSEQPKSPDFDAELRAKAHELRGRRGSCPNALTLIEYRNGALPQDESGAIREHLNSCGLCDTALARLNRTLETRSRKSWVIPGLSVLVAATAILFSTKTPETPAAVDALQPAAFLDPNAVRSANTRIPSAGPDSTVVLSFFVPMEPGRRYSATLRRPDGPIRSAMIRFKATTEPATAFSSGHARTLQANSC